ncbi:MAG: hypothetical protein QM788_05540 [Roseateles sp.]|uniref:hypothetical protein n=1 Tax=Roseateles sp. TaxID=1971397 RepID=UPI0039ED4B44
MNRIRTTTAATRNRLQAASAAALVALAALAGAAWITLAVPAHGPAVVQLERVVIEGRHTPDATTTAAVQKLPRVVIEGRREAGADGTQLASACAAPAAAC